MKKAIEKSTQSSTSLAVSYARVSSREQEKEGFSIDAQQRLLQNYALENSLTIEREFIDVETAKSTGRTNFVKMVEFLKKHPRVRRLLVEKTDRLYRNLKDWIALDELDIEIHLVKENITLSKDSRSTEKFVHGIKVLMAKNYIDNLSEEARKGQLEKAEQGFWPTKAPLGYRNALGSEGKRVIVTDPAVAPIITKMFEWYSTGTLSMEAVAEKARGEGLIYRRTGAAVPLSAIHTILRNRIYTGEFLWKGKLYKGKHDPLISVELFECVQSVIERRNRAHTRHVKHELAFATLLKCGHCGCAIVGQRQKGRLKRGDWVYYRCTGFKGKCGEPFVREEVLAAKFSELLGRLRFDKETFDHISEGLRVSHVEQMREHASAFARLRSEYDRIQYRLHAMYSDKLEERIDADMYDSLSGDLRRQQNAIQRDMVRQQQADESYLQEGITVLGLARNAKALFEKQPPMAKRQLLNFVLSNPTWANGEITASFREPFDLIAETAAIDVKSTERQGRNPEGHSSWLGD